MDAGIASLSDLDVPRKHWMLLGFAKRGSDRASSSSVSAVMPRKRPKDCVRVMEASSELAVSAATMNPSVWVPAGRNPVDCSSLLRVRNLEDEESGTDWPMPVWES